MPSVSVSESPGLSERIAVIDFETTGIAPARGDRPTEIAIVMLEGGRVVGRFQSLMNAGVRIPSFITQLTGITNAMVQTAPSVTEVMQAAADFVGTTAMVAHNASFDSKFWQHELGLLGHAALQPFACTVLLSRRLYPQAPNHQLGTLAQFHRLPTTGQAHRALADAEMAAALLCRIQQDLLSMDARGRADHAWLMRLQRCPKHQVAQLLAS